MNACSDCLHFRPRRRLQELLALPFEALESERSQMADRVADLEDDEAKLLLSLVFRGEGRWPMGAPPLALAYCAFADASNQALVYETKNAAGDCADFASAREIGRAWCKDCVHQVEPEGLARYRRDMAQAAAAGRDGDNARLLRERVDREDAWRRAEMHAVLTDAGVFLERPKYYATCAYFSSFGQFVVSALRNPDGRCSAHQGRIASGVFRGGNVTRPSVADANREPATADKGPLRWRDGDGF